MADHAWTEGDTARAIQYWSDYQSRHDVTDHIGQAVGIDPSDGRVWFGSNAIEVARKRDADGVHTPLYLVRVGRDYYLRKVGRRSK